MQNCPIMLYMKNGKAANARYIGPMTEAVAQELRAELARQKRSAKSLAEDNGLNRSTLHKTLNAQRAIDVDDLFSLAELLNISAAELFARAEVIAQGMVGDGLTVEERHGIDPSSFDEANIEALTEAFESDVPASRHDVALAASDDPNWQAVQEAGEEFP